MPAFSFIFLLALVLLAGPALAAPCMAGMRYIEVPADSPEETQPLCVSPGQTTVLSFDADLAPGSLSLEGADAFTKVEPGASMLKLVPSGKVPLGRPLRVTVRFADSATPSSASLVLVAHADEAASLVEVHRKKRSAESYRQEVKVKEKEARQLREEIARLRADKAGPGGLRGLLASGAMGGEGVASKDLVKGITQPPTNPLRAGAVIGYRSATRVAVELELDNPAGAPAWKAGGAMLTREGQRGARLKMFPVWQAAPITPGDSGALVVEAEATEDEARGTFTLKVWEEGGTRAVTLGGVTFP